MAKVTSNAREVVADVRAVATGFSFNKRGRYKDFGTDMRTAVAELVYDNTVLAQREPGGSPLAPLKESTLREKRVRGYPETILVATGAMLDFEQLKGEAVVTDTTLEMTYGDNERARDLAEYAHEGSRKKKRRKRPFYEIPRGGEASLDALADESLDHQAADTGCE